MIIIKNLVKDQQEAQSDLKLEINMSKHHNKYVE